MLLHEQREDIFGGDLDQVGIRYGKGTVSIRCILVRIVEMLDMRENFDWKGE